MIHQAFLNSRSLELCGSPNYSESGLEHVFSGHKREKMIICALQMFISLPGFYEFELCAFCSIQKLIPTSCEIKCPGPVLSDVKLIS